MPTLAPHNYVCHEERDEGSVATITLEEEEEQEDILTKLEPKTVRYNQSESMAREASQLTETSSQAALNRKPAPKPIFHVHRFARMRD